MNYLYHFTKAEIAIRKILPRMKLRLNILSFMNDPKENLQHIVKFDENVNFRTYQERIGFEEYIIAKLIREETRIVTFSIDKDVLFENNKHHIYGFQLQRMWATYGQNHEGVCFVIDYEKFKKENLKSIEKYGVIDKEVTYDNFQYQGLPQQSYGMSREDSKKHKPKSTSEFWSNLQKDKKFVNKRFFTKNLDWEGESEYRFLSFNKENEEILLSIKDSLSMLILGINFSRYFLPSISELVAKDKIFVIELDSSYNFKTRKVNL